MNIRNAMPNVDRRELLKGGGALGTVALLPAVARAQQAEEPARGGKLRVAMPYNPASLDPTTGRNVPDFNSLYSLFDALIDFDPETLELRPGLARAWEFSDPKTLVLDLVEGVVFHDGTPLDAEAVKFNLDRSIGNPRSNVKSDLTAVDVVEATGTHRVTIRLRQPNAGLPTILTNRAGCMISPAAIKAAPDGNVDRNPVGCGPFKFIEWRDNDIIRVERNPDYWREGLPYLDAIDFRIINELNTAARTVVAGETDLALNLGAQQIATSRRNPDLVAVAGASLTFWTACFNYGVAPLNDVRVRQALNYAINRDDLNKVLMLGLGEPTSAAFPSSFWATDPETANYFTHDPEKARSLLAEAGYPDGIDIPAWGWPDQASMQRQEMIVSQMAEAGIRLKITPAPPAQGNQNFFIEKKGVMMLTPMGGLPDPSQNYERTFAANALFNASGVELDGFRELLDATVATSDLAERTAALHKMQRYVIEQAMHLPMYTSATMSVATKQVRGFTFGLVSGPKFHQVWLAKA